MTKEDIDTFIRRLDKVLASRSKQQKAAKPVNSEVVPGTPKTPTKVVPTIEVDKNGSPGPKKLTYV